MLNSAPDLHLVDGDRARLWHVTVTVAGAARDAGEVRDALQRLADERPFLHSIRYDEGRAEVQYWEEGAEMLDAASLAWRLWPEHRVSADLPTWEVVGLEVVEQQTHRLREPAAGAVGSTPAEPRPF